MIWGETEFNIHDEIMELFLDQASLSRGVVALEAVIDLSMNPSLLLASKAIRIALAHVE